VTDSDLLELTRRLCDPTLTVAEALGQSTGVVWAGDCDPDDDSLAPVDAQFGAGERQDYRLGVGGDRDGAG
jgi:hypothetical protein